MEEGGREGVRGEERGKERGRGRIRGEWGRRDRNGRRLDAYNTTLEDIGKF